MTSYFSPQSSPISNPEHPTFFPKLPGVSPKPCPHALQMFPSTAACCLGYPHLHAPSPEFPPSSSFIMWQDFRAFPCGQEFPSLSRGVELSRCSPVRGGGKGSKPGIDEETPARTAKERGAIFEYVLLGLKVIM